MNTDIRVKTLNTIILNSSATQLQRITAIDLLQKINPVECIKTVKLAHIQINANRQNIDLIVSTLKEL